MKRHFWAISLIAVHMLAAARVEASPGTAVVAARPLAGGTTVTQKVGRLRSLLGKPASQLVVAFGNAAVAAPHVGKRVRVTTVYDQKLFVPDKFEVTKTRVTFTNALGIEQPTVPVIGEFFVNEYKEPVTFRRLITPAHHAGEPLVFQDEGGTSYLAYARRDSLERVGRLVGIGKGSHLELDTGDGKGLHLSLVDDPHMKALVEILDR